MAQVDSNLVSWIAANLGMPVPKNLNPAKSDVKLPAKKGLSPSPALSMIHPKKAAEAVVSLKAALEKQGAVPLIIAPRLGPILGLKGAEPKGTFESMPSILFDGVVIASGAKSVDAMKRSGDALHYVMEAYKHRKTLSAIDIGIDQTLIHFQREGVKIYCSIAVSSRPLPLRLWC